MLPTDDEIKKLISPELVELFVLIDAPSLSDKAVNICKNIFLIGARWQADEVIKQVEFRLRTPSEREEIRDAKSVPTT